MTTTNKQYASLVTAHEYLTNEVMDELRLECIENNGNDFWFRQEFLCDWGQASQTSYYGHILQQIGKRGQVGLFPYIEGIPAYTAWDLGMSDSTAIVTFQYSGMRARIIDSYETHDIADEPTVKFIQSKPYNYGWHFFPHDGSVRDSDAIQRIEKIRDFGLINSSLLKREPREDGIKRVAEHLPQTDFNEQTTEELRRKLGLYKRKFNPLTGDYIGPEHKTESHYADAIRYTMKAIEEDFDSVTGKFYYAEENSQDSYEMDLVATPGYYKPAYGR